VTSLSVTGLSVVVANGSSHGAPAGACAEALAAELDPGSDEVVWVAPGHGRPPAVPRLQVAHVAAPAGASRGDCYGLGLDRARGPVVVLTDTATVVAPGWRAALMTALADGADVVGGPVLPGAIPDGDRRGWAGFLVQYGPHAVPPYRSAAGDVAANNVAYRRHLLRPTSGEGGGGPVWKAELNAGLARRGVRPVLATGMRVTVARPYRWADLSAGQTAAGRLYGTLRSEGWSLPRRLAAAAAGAGLPALLLARLWRTVAPDPALRRHLVASFPMVAAALGAWSVGEARGYLRRDGTGEGVW
jgi:hypothetical protein